jgi:predicted nucleic acid-binding protein
VIVLDASAAIEWLLQSPVGVRIDQRIFSPSETLHAPHLLDVEVAQVLRRYVRDKSITAQRGQEALEDLSDIPLTRYPHDFLIPRIWELRATLTAYDAAYVALAELLDAPLLTCDGKIASASGYSACAVVRWSYHVYDSFNKGPSCRPQQDSAQARTATGRLARGQSRRTTYCPDSTKSSFAKGTHHLGSGHWIAGANRRP